MENPTYDWKMLVTPGLILLAAIFIGSKIRKVA